MRKTEVKMQTSWDVTRSCGAVLPRTLENPQENWYPLGTIKQPVDTFAVMRKIIQGEDSPRRIEAVPPKNLELLSSQEMEGQAIYLKKNATRRVVK